jgi:hypothetical protein
MEPFWQVSDKELCDDDVGKEKEVKQFEYNKQRITNAVTKASVLEVAISA